MAEEIVGGYIPEIPPDGDEHDTEVLVSGSLGPVPVVMPGAGNSLLDAFKEELQELSENEFVFIPVRGYEKTGIQIKYHLPERGKEIAVLSQKVMRETKDSYSRNLFIAMDMMIHLCDGIYAQPEGLDEPTPIDFEGYGYAVQFDERLASMVGLNGESESARIVLRKLFGNNEMAILAHANELQRWLQNTRTNLSTDLWESGE